MSEKIRVLVVDDSALMRKKISEMVNSNGACEVVGTARDGQEAVQCVGLLKPDVITLDLEMPRMDGITALKQIMKDQPTPVVIVSGYTEFHGEQTIRCLEYGAVDFVVKPGGTVSLDMSKVQVELLDKIKTAASVNLKVLQRMRSNGHSLLAKSYAIRICRKMVIIASSTGGPKALGEILPRLDPDIPAGIVVVQHMPAGFTHSLASRLNEESAIKVKEAEDGEGLLPGKAVIAPGGFHMSFESRQEQAVHIKLAKGMKEQGFCPSADITMQSLAPFYGKNCLGVVVTGMGNDGTQGLKEIKKYGGRTIAEDASTCIVFGMPKAAFDAGVVDSVVPLPEIANAIMKWARNKNE